MTTPSFVGPFTNPYGLTNNGTDTNPNFVDLDGDGDLDVLIGDAAGEMLYFQNIGTATVPAFAGPTVNPFGFQTIAAGGTAPASGDLDNDGDLDVLSGDETVGNFHYFQNIGNPTSPAFAAPITNPFGLSTMGAESSPALVDLDKDGDLDVLSGSNSGNFFYFQNIGNSTVPVFAAALTNPFNLTKTPTDSNPTLADIDFDGDYDLLSGTFANGLWVYENIGDSINPLFAAPLVSPYGLIGVYLEMAPSFGDLDGDGKVDVLAITASAGAVNLIYYNNTTPISPSSTATATLSSSASLTNTPSSSASLSASQSHLPVNASPSSVHRSIQPTITLGGTLGTTGTTGKRATTTGRKGTTGHRTTGKPHMSDANSLSAWPEMSTSLMLGVVGAKVVANTFSSIMGIAQSLKSTYWDGVTQEQPKGSAEQSQAMNKPLNELVKQCESWLKQQPTEWLLRDDLEELIGDLQAAKQGGVTEKQFKKLQDRLTALKEEYGLSAQTATAGIVQKQRRSNMSFFVPAQQPMPESIPAVLPQAPVKGNIAA